MLYAISYGFLTGVFLSVGFGAVFFALLQDSVDFGYKSGIKIVWGVVIGDFLLVALAVLGASLLPNIPNFETYARILGAALLTAMAVSQVLSKTIEPEKREFKLSRNLYFIGKGFLLNVLNPVNFLSWAVASTTIKNLRYTPLQTVLFFGVAILMILVCEALVCVFAYKIKGSIKPKLLQKFKYITSSIFVIIALKLIWPIVFR